MGRMQISPEKLKMMLRLIADDSCFKILSEVQKSETYSDALSEKLNIPRSTVWKKLNQLKEAGILESYSATAEVGRRVMMYRFRDVELNFKSISDILRYLKPKTTSK